MKVLCSQCDTEVGIPDGIKPRLTYHQCRPPRRVLRWSLFSPEELSQEECLVWARSQFGGALDRVGGEALLRSIQPEPRFLGGDQGRLPAALPGERMPDGNNRGAR